MPSSILTQLLNTPIRGMETYPYIPAFIREWLEEAHLSSKYPRIEAWWKRNLTRDIAMTLHNQSCNGCKLRIDPINSSSSYGFHYYGRCSRNNEYYHRDSWCHHWVGPDSEPPSQ